MAYFDGRQLMRRLATIHRLPSTILLLAALACRGQSGDAAAAAHPAVAVRTIVATARPMAQLVSAIGVVTPRPGHVADLSAPAATRVARIHAALGQRVSAGEVL